MATSSRAKNRTHRTKTAKPAQPKASAALDAEIQREVVAPLRGQPPEVVDAVKRMHLLSHELRLLNRLSPSEADYADDGNCRAKARKAITTATNRVKKAKELLAAIQHDGTQRRCDEDTAKNATEAKPRVREAVKKAETATGYAARCWKSAKDDTLTAKLFKVQFTWMYKHLRRAFERVTIDLADLGHDDAANSIRRGYERTLKSLEWQSGFRTDLPVGDSDQYPELTPSTLHELAEHISRREHAIVAKLVAEAKSNGRATVTIPAVETGGKRRIGDGIRWQEAKRRAESFVKKNDNKWPGMTSLVEQTHASRNTVYKAIAKSPYLKARRAQAKNKGKPRELSGVRELDQLIQEQATEIHREQCQVIKFGKTRQRPRDDE